MLIPKPSESAYHQAMELHTAMRILQVLAGLLAVGYVARLFVTPKAWKPRGRDVDEHLRRIDPDYTPRVDETYEQWHKRSGNDRYF